MVKYSMKRNTETIILKMGRKWGEKKKKDPEEKDETQPWGGISDCYGQRCAPDTFPTSASPMYYISIGLEIGITWDCYQSLQLFLKVHNVFAQLDIIHPAETEKVWSETCKSSCVTEWAGIIWIYGTVPCLGPVHQFGMQKFNLGILIYSPILTDSKRYLILNACWAFDFLLGTNLCVGHICHCRLFQLPFAFLNVTKHSGMGICIFNGHQKDRCTTLHILQQQCSLGKRARVRVTGKG